MAEAAEKKPDFDAYALSVEVAERFDAVKWKTFNATNLEVRNETRQEVLNIRSDLMKVAKADPALAARVWDDHVPSFVPRPAELPQIDVALNPVNTIEPGRKRRKTGTEGARARERRTSQFASSRREARGNRNRALSKQTRGGEKPFRDPGRRQGGTHADLGNGFPTCLGSLGR